ncbi:MAG: ferritin [Actinomycetes bacterium]
MASDRFAAQLNEQIAYEFGASQQYIAVAVHYDGDSLPQLAGFFYRQAVEERNHAMMMVQYLLDADAEVVVPAVAAPRTSFTGIVEPVEIALAQEKKVTEQITALARTAREDGDFVSEQFTQWFLKEQVEEVATMSTLLTAVQRGENDVLQVEDWVAREHGAGEGGDMTAPGAAGGAL